MWLNYPNNPTGAVAPLSFFEEAVDFCRRYDILLCHDAPYADVCFDGYRRRACCRCRAPRTSRSSSTRSPSRTTWPAGASGMAVGNSTAIAALLQMKSNMDSGIFLAVQDAAVAALTGDQSWIAERNAEYQRRRDAIYDVLVHDLGLEVALPVASLYLWPKVPAGLHRRRSLPTRSCWRPA